MQMSMMMMVRWICKWPTINMKPAGVFWRLLQHALASFPWKKKRLWYAMLLERARSGLTGRECEVEKRTWGFSRLCDITLRFTRLACATGLWPVLFSILFITAAKIFMLLNLIKFIFHSLLSVIIWHRISHPESRIPNPIHDWCLQLLLQGKPGLTFFSTRFLFQR